MKIVLDVTKITLLADKNGMDKIVLTVDMPEGVWPYRDTSEFVMFVSNGAGMNYIRNNISEAMDVEVINV